MMMAIIMVMFYLEAVSVQLGICARHVGDGGVGGDVGVEDDVVGDVGRDPITGNCDVAVPQNKFDI